MKNHNIRGEHKFSKETCIINTSLKPFQRKPVEEKRYTKRTL